MILFLYLKIVNRVEYADKKSSVMPSTFFWSRITSPKGVFLFKTKHTLPMLKVVFLLSFLFCFLNFIFFSFFHCALSVLQTGSVTRSEMQPQGPHCGEVARESQPLLWLPFRRAPDSQELGSLSMYCISYKSMECILNYCPTYTYFITPFNVLCKVPTVMLKR